MIKRLILLFAMTAMWQFVKAQSYYNFYYDAWFDGDRSTLTHGMFTPGENELTFDLSAMPWPGLHFLNIVPYYEWGDMGVWKIIPFLMPEGWPNSTEAASVEYWVTSYDKKPKSIPFGNEATALDIDLSNMSCGLHFLNYRVLSESGYPGPWKILPFYMSSGTFGEEEMHYDYWIDSEETVKSGTGIMPGTVDLEIDTSHLTDSKHTFYFKACNLLNTYGELFSTTFDIENGIAVSIEDILKTQEKHLTIRAEGGVLIIDSNSERDVNIYQTNGMLVRHVHLTEGQNIVADLQPGIYIIEGMKFVLR